MIQGTATSLIQTSFGTDGTARFGSQTASPAGSGVRSGDPASAESGGTSGLTAEEQREVQSLKQTDRKVRDHEQAHLTVGADLVRAGATFSYQTGPDNQRYAVAGEVSIDVSPGRSAEETIAKAQRIRAAALAPADPSPQDRRVAARASRMEGEARTELAAEQQNEVNRRNQASSSLYRNLENGASGSSKLPIGGRLDLFA